MNTPIRSPRRVCGGKSIRAFDFGLVPARLAQLDLGLALRPLRWHPVIPNGDRATPSGLSRPRAVPSLAPTVLY